jgi:hypothetical protein
MYLHDAHLANIVTSYCTCLAGIMPILWTLLTRRQPGRWLLVYACILLTGIPTVWLHTVEGNRLASFFDVGSNIFLAWALLIGVSGDFLSPARRLQLRIAASVANAGVLVWLAYEVVAPQKTPLLTFGSWGQFYAGEVALILNCWVVVGLFVAHRAMIPKSARPLLYLIVVIFLIGMLFATAGNDQISFYIIPWHACWHILGSVGFMTLWVFNDTRFRKRGT